MKANIKFEKDYDSWYLTPSIGVGTYSCSTIIGIASLCFMVQLEIYK